MRLGLTIGFYGPTVSLDMQLIQEAERLGYEVVWTFEGYGADAISPLAWIGAQTKRIKLGTGIMQMQARTPASTAMTAVTMDQLSGGRFILGIGASGPQVIEGWHGLAYGKPLARTREYVAILRKIMARESPLEHQGAYYQIPYRGDDATGLGKPLKSILHGRKDLPIYLAAIGPKNVELAAELADGWIPAFLHPEKFDLFEPSLQSGFDKAGEGKGYPSFDIAPYVDVAVGRDVRACIDAIKPHIALYIGGMGAKGRNFYNDLACRYGYGEAAGRVQELYLSGRQREAVSAVPDDLVDAVSLCGPKERIQDRLARWRKIPISTLNLTDPTPEALRTLAELVL